MPKQLSTNQIERYQRDGVLTPLRVLSEEETTRYRRAYEELEERLGGRPKATQLSLTHLYFPWAYELVTHPKVLDAVEDLLGPDILVWSSSIFAKRARDPAYISFHQDGTYWGLGSTQVTTAWIALTPSTVENGCMRVAPATHLDPIHPHVETHAENNMLTRGQEVQAEVDESQILDIVLQPGEMSLHHVSIIHGSNPNLSDHKRIGFAIRYMTPQVRQLGEPNPVVLARGQDEFHHNELLETPPAPANLEEAIQRHQEAARKHLEALTKTEAAT
jgi:ectoine hydroxylase-related dioxygenase (phytanoyl-CoA dioxygenase family)